VVVSEKTSKRLFERDADTIHLKVVTVLIHLRSIKGSQCLTRGKNIKNLLLAGILTFRLCDTKFL